VAATANLLEAMREADVGRLVFSSTAAVYGEPEEVPIPEGHAKRPVNPYGRSKWMVEEIFADCARAFDLRAIALRYFNAAGADPDGETGELHDPETHLIPLALRAASGGKPLTLFGDDYPTADGTCVRDYVHVTDLANAHRLALERLLAGGAGGAFNLGTATGFTVRQVLDAVERTTGRKVAHSIGPRRPGDPAVLVASNAKAREELGWQPRFGLEEIVETAWRWETVGRTHAE
jgi:UDP-glucose-4-epimerase GalE